MPFNEEPEDDPVQDLDLSRYALVFVLCAMIWVFMIAVLLL